MTPTDRVDALLRETRGSPSAGDLRRMVEEAEASVLVRVEALSDSVGWIPLELIRALREAIRNGAPLTFAQGGALARERK